MIRFLIFLGKNIFYIEMIYSELKISLIKFFSMISS